MIGFSKEKIRKKRLILKMREKSWLKTLKGNWTKFLETKYMKIDKSIGNNDRWGFHMIKPREIISRVKN
jgi:hypothetical protein